MLLQLLLELQGRAEPKKGMVCGVVLMVFGVDCV